MEAPGDDYLHCDPPPFVAPSTPHHRRKDPAERTIHTVSSPKCESLKENLDHSTMD